jgi:polyisoprenyl-phosphate glycosyltransferase
MNHIGGLEAALAQVRTLEQELTALVGKQPAPLLTFLSPCYDEEESIEALYRAITDTCIANRIDSYEILWIENGSRDRSESIMRRLSAADPRLRVFQLSRNFGFQGAITCGFHHARGEWVAVLDADLQDPPQLIPEMLTKAKTENLDVVFGVRRKRKEGLWKRLCYWGFYRLWSVTASIPVQLDSGDFGLIHRRVVDSINAMPERMRFIRGLRAWSGFRQAGFEYERAARQAGVSKFSFAQLVSFAADGIVAYSTVPLRMTFIGGLGIVSLCLLLGVVQLSLRLLFLAGVVPASAALPPGLATIYIVIVGLIGLNMLCLGMVGEYVGRIYNESKARPHYLIRDRF